AEPTAVEELRPEVPAPLAALMRRLMAKKPEDRFQTPAELALALKPFARPGPATPPSRSAAAPRGDAGPATPGPEEWPSEAPTAIVEGGALVGTLPPDLSPTPLSTEDMPVAPVVSDDRRLLRSTLLCAVGIVAGLVGAVGLLLFVR